MLYQLQQCGEMLEHVDPNTIRFCPYIVPSCAILPPLVYKVPLCHVLRQRLSQRNMVGSIMRRCCIMRRSMLFAVPHYVVHMSVSHACVTCHMSASHACVTCLSHMSASYFTCVRHMSYLRHMSHVCVTYLRQMSASHACVTCHILYMRRYL